MNLNYKNNIIFHIPRLAVIVVLKIYQKIFSFDHGILKVFYPFGFCRFYPTCSEYSIQSIEKYGLIRGAIKTIKRIGRCHPWSRGGYDPVK